MKNGIIYGDWAIILELDEKDNIVNVLRKSGLYYFIKDWRNIVNSKLISQKFFISDKNNFIKQLSHFKNDLNEVENAKWELEVYKINNYEKIFSLPFYPRVSVILSSFNSSSTIENSIRSIIKQTYPNIELIVIDDCSEDNNLDKIMRMKEKYGNRINNFEIIRNEKNMGVYFSRNLGINKSSGSIITIQDADDLSESNRISISVYELINSNVEFVLGNGLKFEYINDLSPVFVTMATFLCSKMFFEKYGMYDENTRHSGDLELLDRAYFFKYGNYEFENFWYWLNYTSFKQDFYKHIYENLYFIGNQVNSITKNNNLNKRMQYLKERRKIMKNKM